MDWNDPVIDRPHSVLDGIATVDHAYFVHSYQFRVVDPAHLLAHVDYGWPITAIVGTDTRWARRATPKKARRRGCD